MDELQTVEVPETAAEQSVSTDARKATKIDLMTKLDNIERSSKRQYTFALLRTIFMGILAVCAVAVVFIVNDALFNIIPQVNAAIADVDDVVNTLNEVDIVGISKEINTLATTGTEGINTALGDLEVALDSVTTSISMLQSIDIDALNQAITDLSDTVGPLANFFKVLG